MQLQPTEIQHLTAALAHKIEQRRPAIAAHVRYMRGEQGKLAFASDEFKRYYSARFSSFSDNWCAPVIAACSERITFKGLQPTGNQPVPASVMRAWDASDADRGFAEAVTMMMATGRAYGLVTQKPQGGARISFENPDSCAVSYDAWTGEPLAGLCVRYDDRREYASLFTPDAVYRLDRARPGFLGDSDRRLPPDVEGWAFRDGSPNPLGAVPLIEFRNACLLDNRPQSDLAQVEPMQDAVNLVWAYLLNSLDYATLPSRVILGGDSIVEPVFDDEGKKVGTRPAQLDKTLNERILQLTGAGVKIDEWSPSSLDSFIPVIEKAVEHIAAETRTPGHYLLTKSEVPATGYDASEAGLVSKANERIGFLRHGIREMLRLTALTEGDADGATVVAASKPVFASPLYRSDTQLMDALLKAKQIGFPTRWLFEQYGLSPDEVERVMRMAEEEAMDTDLENATNALKELAGNDGDEDTGGSTAPHEPDGPTRAPALVGEGRQLRDR